MNLKDLEKLDQLGLIYFSVGLTCQNVKGEYKKKMYFKEPWSQITTSKFDKSRNAIVVRTGNISNCFVIDIDDETKEEARELCNLCFAKSNLIVKTNKGYHFYFKYDECFNCTKTYTNYGFDIKSNMGIITAPPSYYRHPIKGWITYKFIKVGTELSYVSDEIKSYLLELIKPSVNVGNELVLHNIIDTDILCPNRKQEIMLKLLDSLNIDRCSNFSDWLNVGFCLANSGHDVNLWDYFSKRTPKYDKISNEYYYKKVFGANNKKNNTDLTEKTLWYYLKLDNPKEYEILCEQIKTID